MLVLISWCKGWSGINLFQGSLYVTFKKLHLFYKVLSQEGIYWSELTLQLKGIVFAGINHYLYQEVLKIVCFGYISTKL
jgi:hypothetical protein